MYEIIKQVILSKRYSLIDMLAKIDTIWLQNDITNQQKDELVQLAQTNAEPHQSYAPIEERVTDGLKRIKVLENQVANLVNGQTATIPLVDEYPQFVQPTGEHDAYHNGDKITFMNKKYTCIIPQGQTCMWSPETMPQHWNEVV